MICVAVTYIARPGNEDEVARLLGVMTGFTRQEEPGCLMYQAHCSVEDPRRFFLYEQYTGQEALDAHRAAPYFQQYVLNGLVPLLESRTPLLYEPI